MSTPSGPRTRVLVTHPSAELYGSDRMLLEAVRALVGAGGHVVVVLPAQGPLVERLRAAGAVVRTLAVPVLRKSSMTPRGALALLRDVMTSTVPTLRLLREVRPDVAYVSTLTTPTWPLLARSLGVRVVAHVHEAEPGAPRAVQQLLALPLLAASVVIANSGFARDVLVAALPPLRRRTRVVLNGVEGPPAGPVPGPPAGAVGDARPLRITYIGRISRRKGVLVAVEALALLRRGGLSAELHLVGDSYDEHQDFVAEFEAATARPDLTGFVHRHGFGEVWPHLAAADVVLVPSLLPEPFGNTAVEAVLAARPVVASRCGGLPEALAGVESAHLVETGDPVALAAAVEDVAADLLGAHRRALVDSGATAERFATARYGRDLVALLIERATRVEARGER